MVTPTASGHLQIQPQVEHHPLLHFLDSNTTVSTLSNKEQQFASSQQNNGTTTTGVIAHCIRNSCPDRPFMCSVCRRAFSQQSTLANHLKTHTGEKPYKCKICESNFRQVSTLNNHMKIHTGEKPYVCSYCPKQFRQKSTLTNHVRIHTGWDQGNHDDDHDAQPQHNCSPPRHYTLLNTFAHSLIHSSPSLALSPFMFTSQY